MCGGEEREEGKRGEEERSRVVVGWVGALFSLLCEVFLCGEPDIHVEKTAENVLIHTMSTDIRNTTVFCYTQELFFHHRVVFFLAQGHTFFFFFFASSLDCAAGSRRTRRSPRDSYAGSVVFAV